MTFKKINMSENEKPTKAMASGLVEGSTSIEIGAGTPSMAAGTCFWNIQIYYLLLLELRPWRPEHVWHNLIKIEKCQITIVIVWNNLISIPAWSIGHLCQHFLYRTFILKEVVIIIIILWQLWWWSSYYDNNDDHRHHIMTILILITWTQSSLRGASGSTRKPA